MPTADPATRFLRAVFRDADEHAYLLLWTLPGRVSHWYTVTQLDDAIAFVKQSPNLDVYVGVALSSEDYGPGRRCPAEHTQGIVALWADVDYLGDAHKKSNLPPDENAARTLLTELGVEPSIVVHSGHGLQAWWLLAEPWYFGPSSDDPDRNDAAELAARWNGTLRARAAAHGWTVDSTHDLARVMRVPGSRNQKTSPPASVEIAVLNKRRYSPSDFDAFLVEDSEWKRLSQRSGYLVGQLRLDADASPAFDKLDALLSNDTKFRATWERSRRDMKDDSPSAWDQSLASLAAAVGWSDQEIADLLIASRRKHGDDLKLRADYYARTIAKARDDRSRDMSVEEIEGQAERVDVAVASGSLSEAHHTRRDLVDTIATMLGIKCTRFVRFKQDPPRYRMETVGGAVTIGPASAVLSQPMMRAAIASATGIVIPVYKQKKWHAIAQAIFSACEDEDTGMESTDEGLAYAWLSEYLQDRTVLPTRDEAIEQSWPYVEDGALFIFGAPLRRWLWMTRAERVSASRMGEVLRSFGAAPTVVAVTVREKRSTRSVWRVEHAEDLGVGPTGRPGTIGPGDEGEGAEDG